MVPGTIVGACIPAWVELGLGLSGLHASDASAAWTAVSELVCNIYTYIRFLWELPEPKSSHQAPISEIFRVGFIFFRRFRIILSGYCCIKERCGLGRRYAIVTCAHMTGLNGTLDALHIRVCIPTN